MTRSLLLLLVLTAATSEVRADLRVGVHLGGGVEAGLITGKPRPDAVSEAGLSVEAFLPGRWWGVGFTAEAVGRLTDIRADEEAKLDVSFRWKYPRARARGGVGVGARLATLDRGDGMTEAIHGYDLIRFDTAFELARWELARGPTISLDGRIAWTFGCYRDQVTRPPVGDMVAPTRDLACTDTITNTYVFGIGTSVRWD